MYMEIPCSHRSDIPATVSQHFGCPTGGVWKEPGSWKGWCLGLSDNGFPSSCIEWAVKTGACGWAAVAAVPMCPPFPPCFSSCLLQSHIFRALQDLLQRAGAFLLFSPMSPHLPDLYSPKDPLFPLQELLRKVAVI